LEIAAKISILGDLGQGSYGKVSVGSWNGAPVAVKMLHGVFFEVGLSETDSQMTSFLRKFQDEWQTMKVLRHPNILQLYGVADAQSKHAKIVSELMDESLASRLAKAPKLNHPMHLHILKSIICGLRYLHEHPSGPIVHRDLTSKNILLADNANRVKIADLGVAKAMSDIRAAMGTIMPGTELYMPPEVRSRVAIHTSLDIFSYGVLAIETLLAKSPSPGPLFVAVAENPGCFTVSKETVRRESELQSIPSDHPLKETVLACLNNDATVRPTAAHIFLTVFQHLSLTTTVEQTVWQGDNARLESDITRLKNHITKLTRDNAKLTRENTKLRRENTELNHDVAKLIGNKRLEARRLNESMSDLHLHERNLFSTSEVSKGRPCSIALPATATSVASDRWYTLPRRRHRPRPQSFPHPISKNSETEVMPLYVAKYDYEASTENELSFQSGSLLYVLDDSNELWWWAKLEIEDKEGYIPVSYVEVYKTLLKYE
jgi:serine/threonine protein kinase